MKKIYITLTYLLILTPLVSHAAVLGGVSDLFKSALEIVTKYLIPLAFAAAVLFFIWGIARYILGGAEDKEKAKNVMIWGVVALFVMSSIWGLVRFLQRDLLGGIVPTNVPIPGIGSGGDDLNL